MHFPPLIGPLLIAAIVWRRAMRPQKPRTVRATRLWIFPGLLLFVTIMSLWLEGVPGVLTALVFLIAAGAGGALGWFRVHTLEFSLDAESGRVSTRATQLGALVIIGLIVLRYLANYAIQAFGLSAGAKLVHATDATLLFSTSMLVARSVHTWMKARVLIEAHRQKAVSASDSAPVRPGQGGAGT
jgi:hypothetical protein